MMSNLTKYMATSISILCYHQVAPQLPPGFERYSVTTAQFAAQLRWLALAGYHTISFDQMLAARAGKGSLPAKSVIITFDDGLRDCIHYAPPLLVSYKMTATFFLVAGLMGGASAWLAQEQAPVMPIASWQQARDLLAAGMSCGAHGLTHTRLAATPALQCEEELVQSRRLLESELGSPIRHIAYPFGSYNVAVRAQVMAAGYATACTTQKGRVALTDDVFSLRRVPVYSFENIVDFAFRVRSGYSFREWLRSRYQKKTA